MSVSQVFVNLTVPPEVLGQEPVSASLVLNEHLRFNRPGRYRLFVVSNRVEPVDQYAGLSVASNVIDLEILPADASWQQRLTAEAVAALRNDGDTTELEAACRVLRFVGTAEAVIAILDHYPLRAARSCQHEFSFGLIGAPPSLMDYAAREMMLRLRDPHYPIRPRFLRDLAFLTYLTQHPDYAVSAGTPLAAWADRRSAYDRILEQCVEDLANAITAKEGRALAISAMTLDDFREVFPPGFGHALGLISQRTRYRMLVQPPPWEQPTPDGVLETLFKLAQYTREIHDTLLQTLAGLALKVATVEEQMGPATDLQRAKQDLAGIRKQIQRSIRETCQSIWDLRSPDNKPSSLETVLREAGSTICEKSGSFDLVVHGKAVRYPRTVEQELLGIVKESLRNAVHHSGAERVRVDLQYTTAGLCLRLSDDGRGFRVDESTPTSGNQWGLIGIRERAEQIGARLDIRSRPRAGTVVEVTVPIDSEA